jgi:hypothetical protein
MGLSVEVAYVWIHPMIAVDVAVLLCVSVRAPEPPPRVTSPVSVEAPSTVSVVPTVRAADAVTAPVSVEAPVTLNVPPVEMFVEIVEDAFTAETTNNIETKTAPTTTHPSFLKSEISLIN